MNDGQNPNFGGFVVIGAGLPRTGTLSLNEGCSEYSTWWSCLPHVPSGFWWKSILCLLGKSPQKKNDPKRVEIFSWRSWVSRWSGLSNFSLLHVGQLKHYMRGLNFEGYFFRDLMDAFPKAKLVLTVREPEAWYESVKSSIYQARNVHEKFPTNVYLWLRGQLDNLLMANKISSSPQRGEDKSM